MHAGGKAEVEWDEIQTYTVDDTGRAVMSDFALVPKTNGIEAFLECIGKDNIGNRSFHAPPDSPRSFTITEPSIRFFQDMSREDIMEAIPMLERQLAMQQDISPELREEMELRLAFWQCLLLRGVHSSARVGCRREIYGEDD